MYHGKVGFIDKIPQFRYAVYSKTPEKQEHELECSAESEDRAKRFFEQYKTWGLTDTSFFLVDWQDRKMIASHKPSKAVTYGDR